MAEIIIVGMIITLVVVIPGFSHAAFNETINYQGKLIDSSGMAVSNGNQCLKFRLMDSQSPGGNELWSEEWHSSTSYITTNSGLFSTLLGTHNSLSSFNFNSASIYLEVQYDPGCDGTYEEVFSPRKQFGAVPAAFEAKKLLGNDWSTPAAIGVTTANSGAFTTLSASNGVTVSSGNISVATNTGQITFGTTGDVNLYRDSANVLRTDDSLAVYGNIGIGTTQTTASLEVRGNVATGTNGTEFIIDATGNITSGAWHASTITVDHGGTGAITLTQYGVLYGNGTGAIGATAAGTNNQVLIATTGSAPSWTNISGLGSQIDHGSLLDLTADDHTQYALLNGRSGGQTLIGGIAANNVLTIQANSASTGNTATNTAIAMKVGNSGGTTAMTILNNGNIGIGTAAPASPLEVNGVFRMTDGSSGCMKFDNSRMALVYADDCTNYHYLYYGSGWQDDGTTVRLITNTDLVSIGTTTGSSPLNIYRSGSDPAINFNEAAAATNWTMGIDQSDSGKFKISRNVSLGAYDFLTLQTDGNVGVGTSAPSDTMTVTNTNQTFDAVYYYNGSAYTNNTTEAKTSDGTPYTVLAGTTNYFYVGKSTTFSKVYFDLVTLGVGATVTAQYYNGTTWTALTVTDGTSNFTTDGSFTFTTPGTWATTAVNGTSAYWIRFATSSAPSTNPTAWLTVPDTKMPLGIFAQAGDATPSFAVDQRGHVGINNNNPGFLLTITEPGITPLLSTLPAAWNVEGRGISVQGSGAAFFNGRDVTNNIEFMFGSSANGGAFSGTVTAHDYWLRTNNLERVTIQADTGNVGIGTTSPTMPLDVNGTGIGLSFMSMQHRFREDFAKDRANVTADSLVWGDTQAIGFNEIASITLSIVDDTTNGISRCATNSTGDGCDLGLAGPTAGTTANRIYNAANKPIGLFQVRPSVIGANNDVYVGFTDDENNSLTTEPTNGVFFTNNNLGGTTPWVGVIKSGANRGTVTCTGQNISTTNFALMRIDVLSTTEARFYIDTDITDGTPTFFDCGTATLPSSTLTTNMTFTTAYKVNTGGTGAANFDVDFIETTQDDPITGVADNYDQSAGVDTIANADLAEAYLSDDVSLLIPGTVLSIDKQSGGKATMSSGQYDKNLIGVVTTSPHTVMGDERDGTETVRLALSGRVPVNVNIENGPIIPGDYLTSSSIPGQAMKATKAGPIIGKALEYYNEINADGQVMMFVSSSIYTGEFDSSQEGKELLNQILTRNTTLNEGISADPLSLLHVDKILAERELSVPKINANEILVNTISSYDSNLVMGFNSDNQLTIKSKATGLTAVTIDDYGNAYFSGDIYANNITATAIDNQSINSLSNNIRSVESDINDLRNEIASNNYVTLANLGIAQNNGALIFNTDTTFNGHSLFTALAEFNNQVIFNDNIQINNQIKLGTNIAGTTIIKPGETSIEVEFDQPYDSIPYININLTPLNSYTEEQKAIIQSLIFNNRVRYIVSETSKEGFTITINTSQEIELPFTWQSYIIDEIAQESPVKP